MQYQSSIHPFLNTSTAKSKAHPESPFPSYIPTYNTLAQHLHSFPSIRLSSTPDSTLQRNAITLAYTHVPARFAQTNHPPVPKFPLPEVWVWVWVPVAWCALIYGLYCAVLDVSHFLWEYGVWVGFGFDLVDSNFVFFGWFLEGSWILYCGLE
ncbi:hypothetical protein EYC80_009698 [Monilinia laxa]|uniref:Uncharacterized protein n=1 Tax=Monilinia laxa TaxID=61186 RepID=A0A5N6JYN4_MONLA|nr:hypothetical protein EYC80_009698 [Monilinia laxa]